MKLKRVKKREMVCQAQLTTILLSSYIENTCMSGNVVLYVKKTLPLGQRGTSFKKEIKNENE